MRIDPRGVQEGTHSLVLDGTGRSLTVEAEPDLRLRNPRIEGELVLEGQDCRVRGSLTGILEIACDRCLAPIDVEVGVEFDAALSGGAPSAPGEVAEAEAPGVLDLTGALREAVLLEIPIKSLCREDCRGLCSRCGANRNSEPCTCDTTPRDPRWSALKDLSFSKDPEE